MQKYKVKAGMLHFIFENFMLKKESFEETLNTPLKKLQDIFVPSCNPQTGIKLQFSSSYENEIFDIPQGAMLTWFFDFLPSSARLFFLNVHVYSTCVCMRMLW